MICTVLKIQGNNTAYFVQGLVLNVYLNIIKYKKETWHFNTIIIYPLVCESLCVCEIGLWRYWIFPYHHEAVTNIAVWRLIAGPPHPSKKNWLVQVHGLHAAEPQHIVAGVRFHWSREEMHFQREPSWVELHSLHQHEHEGARSRTKLNTLEDLVFKLK